MQEGDVLRSLRGSEARFRTLAGSTPTAIFECDLQGTINYANERWCDLVGRGPIGQAGLVDRIHPEDLEHLAALWIEDITASEPKGFDARCRMVHADGVWHWFDIAARPVFDDEGKHTSYLGALHDVTELVEAPSAQPAVSVDPRGDLRSRGDPSRRPRHPVREPGHARGRWTRPGSRPERHRAHPALRAEGVGAGHRRGRRGARGTERLGWRHPRSARGDGVETILSHVIVRGTDEDGPAGTPASPGTSPSSGSIIAVSGRTRTATPSRACSTEAPSSRRWSAAWSAPRRRICTSVSCASTSTSSSS